MTAVGSVDPRTGETVEQVAQETTEEAVDAICQAALAAYPLLEAMGRDGRARMLRAMADALDGDRAEIVRLADRETALGETRLNGELTRTAFQLRLFAEVLLDGGYLEATIDHPGDTAMGPRPDLRRMLIPVGPVGVFGASNFPLAFSVPGGDTASALAAGCPAVIKAHPAHPATSQRTFERLLDGARAAGAPDGTVSLVHGQAAGGVLVRHPAIRAVGFTGSLRGGRALFDIASARPDPIPFYGELGSLNPLVVTPAAAAERGAEIAAGYLGSVTMGVGQFCTKPGLAFVPAGATELTAALAEATAAAPAGWMLSGGIRDAFEAGSAAMREQAGVSELATSTASPDGGFSAVPRLVRVAASDLDGPLLEECFGPTAVVAEYADENELLATLGRLEGALTATLHIGDGETDLPRRVAESLSRRAGRVIYNAYPTGVAVTWAMHHGGPWPATTSELHTSVGTTAIRRFLRPISFQGAPQALLPEELRDGKTGIPRRIDGTLTLDS
ncbi:MAG TPA: aldehyde dehydrogenase (NADP(+)) [Mycobacteriales bacterium]|nr:aldehyde dehydrogenase (NADP(+)) [Mycobacteriales bacterium]